MSEKPILIFEKRFGSLHPVNPAAEDAIKAIDSRCRVEIKRYGANERRRALYWVMLGVASRALTDASGIPFDEETLHDDLRRSLKFGEEYVTPSGRVIFKPRSTSNREMSEIERARWFDRCAHVLSTWLGVEIDELIRESRERAT